MAILKTLLVVLAFAVVGGIVGLLMYAFLIQRGWWDGPGGGMMLFPLVLLPAFCGGFYGFALRRNKFQSS